jgi:transcriptional regulator with XRE-family HTH domain
MFTMTWKTKLGEQIRQARTAREMSQGTLSAQIKAKLGVSCTRARISQIENGIGGPPAVNIVTAIAEILTAELEIEGCKIGKPVELVAGEPTLMPKQLCLPFDAQLSFSASLTLTSLPDRAISLQAIIKCEKVKPIQFLDASGSKAATA